MQLEYASSYRRIDIKDLIHHHPESPSEQSKDQLEILKDGQVHIEMRLDATEVDLVDGLRICHISSSPTISWNGSASYSQSSYDFELVDLRPPRRVPRSNVPYSDEALDFIRYYRVDLGLPWGGKTCPKTGRIRSALLLYFKRRFPNSKVLSPDGLHSRFYRDNQFFLIFDENDEVVLKNGVPCWQQIKMRDGKREGKMLKESHPEHTLVAMYPHRALTYEWVSDEDKAAILKSLEDPRARKRFEQKKTWSKKNSTNVRSTE